MKTLREWRALRNLSYRQLAQRAGVARWTVTRIDSGRGTRINRSTMLAIAAALAVDPADIAEFAADIDPTPRDPASGTQRTQKPRRTRRMVSGTPTNGANPPRAGRTDKIRVAIIGVGNCASSLVQGVHYYRDAPADQFVPGLMHVDLGGYHVGDIEFSAAFDVDATKVGQDLADAIWAEPNNTIKFADVPPPASPSSGA